MTEGNLLHYFTTRDALDRQRERIYRAQTSAEAASNLFSLRSASLQGRMQKKFRRLVHFNEASKEPISEWELGKRCPPPQPARGSEGAS